MGVDTAYAITSGLWPQIHWWTQHRQAPRSKAPSLANLHPSGPPWPKTHPNSEHPCGAPVMGADVGIPNLLSSCSRGHNASFGWTVGPPHEARWIRTVATPEPALIRRSLAQTWAQHSNTSFLHLQSPHGRAASTIFHGCPQSLRPEEGSPLDFQPLWECHQAPTQAVRPLQTLPGCEHCNHEGRELD